jgi:hypothetical protein
LWRHQSNVVVVEVAANLIPEFKFISGREPNPNNVFAE